MNVFEKNGYYTKPWKPTIDATLLLEDVAAEYGVFIGVIVQPTHRFDFNACDALYHSVVKRRVRQYPFPLCQEHILRDYASAVKEVSTDRVIQRSFWRVIGETRRAILIIVNVFFDDKCIINGKTTFFCVSPILERF